MFLVANHFTKQMCIYLMQITQTNISTQSCNLSEQFAVA